MFHISVGGKHLNLGARRPAVGNLRTTLVWLSGILFLLLSSVFCALAAQGWSEGEWNEPTFVLKRVCQVKQTTATDKYYEVGMVEGHRRKIGVLGPQPGDNPKPSAEVSFNNGASCRVELLVDAPASFSARAGAEITCRARVTVTAPGDMKAGRKIRLSLKPGVGSDDADTLETEFVPGQTFTKMLEGSIKIIHKKWDPKFRISGPSWSWLRIPVGRTISADTTSMRMEAVNSMAFDMGPIAALKNDISETFEVYGRVAGEPISADVICIYEGTARKQGEGPEVATPPPPVTPPPPPVAQPDDPTAPRAVKVTDDSSQAEETRRLFRLFKRVREMERKVEMTNVQLALTGQAISDLRERIALLNAASKDQALYEVERETASEKAAELRKQLGELMDSQDKLIKDVTVQFHELTVMTGVEKDRLEASADYNQKLSAVHATLASQDELLPLQMYFAADRREKFQDISRDLLSKFVQRDAVLRLRAMDYMRHGEPRAALYALRESLNINPNDVVTKAMAADVEVGYLRAIAAKTAGDAAEVREKFNEALMGKGDTGWLNYAKDLFTTGPGALISVATGKLEAQERLAATMGDEAAVTQAGTQIIIRLRQKGYSWDDIKAMDAGKFSAAMLKVGGAQGAALDDKTAKRMRASVFMALQNPDVKRLMSQTREQFDSDRGTSYFATDAFDVTWVDHAADAVNISNVASMIPGAAIGRAGTFKLVNATELADAASVSQSLMAGMKLGELAALMEKSKAGKLALAQINRFHEETGIVSKMLAQAIVDQGILEVGQRMGGRPGEIAAQVLTTLGATDIDSAISAMQRRGLKAADAQRLLSRSEKQLDAAKQLTVGPKEYGPKLEKAKAVLNAEELSLDAQQQLRTSADGWFNREKPNLTEGPFFQTNDAARLQAHKGDVVYEGLEAATHGEKARLKPTEDYLQEIEKESVEQAEEAAKQVEVLDKVSKRMKEVPPADVPEPVVTGGQGGSAGGARGSDVTGGGGGEVAGAARGGDVTGGPKGGKKEIKTTKLNNEALVDVKLTEDLGHEAKAADEAFRLQQYDKAAAEYALLLESPNVPAQVKAKLAQRIKLIEDMKRASVEEAVRRRLADKAGKRQYIGAAFDSQTEHYIDNLQESDLVSFAGETSFAKPMKILEQAAGQGNGPRKEIAVFKRRRFINEQGEVVETGMEGELAFARLGPMLGIKTPYVTPVTIHGKSGPIEGYVIRWVDDAPKVADVSVASMLNAKKGLAEERVVSLFAGDHDRHAANNLLAEGGDIISIDHGMADLMEATFRTPGMSRDDARKVFAQVMELKIDKLRKDSDNIRLLDKYICYEDVEPMVERIKQLTPAQLEEVVKAAYVGQTLTKEQLELAVDNFKLKQEVIEEVFRKKFPPARSAA